MTVVRAYLLFLFIVMVYVSFFTEAHLLYFQDTYDFIYRAEQAQMLPKALIGWRHIAYVSLGYLFFQLWDIFGWKAGAMIPFQTMSAIFGAGGVVVFYFIIKRLFEDRRIALFSSLFLGFSYGYWFFSIEAVQSMPSLFFRMLTVLLLFRISGINPLRTFLYLGLLHSVSIFFDLLSILFVPVVVIGIYTFCKDSENGSKIMRILTYLFTVFVIVGLVYSLLAYSYFGCRSFRDLLELITAHSEPVILAGNRFRITLETLVKSLSFNGPVYFTNVVLSRLHTIINAALPAVFSFALIYIAVSHKRLPKQMSKVRAFSAAWILSLIPLYYYQEPGALEFYVYLIPPLLLLLIMAFWHIKRCLRVRAGRVLNYSVVILLFVFSTQNFVYGILPQSDSRHNKYYNEFTFLKQNSDYRDLIMVFSTFEEPFSDLAIYYLNKTEGGLSEDLIPVSCLYEKNPGYYKRLYDLASQHKNIVLFFLPIVRDNRVRELKEARILNDVRNMIGRKMDTELTQHFLNNLISEYEIEAVLNKEGLDSCLIRLSKK